MSLIEDLTNDRLLAIIRGKDVEASIQTAIALVDEGVRSMEISLSSEDALTVLSEVSAALGDRVRLGAGTVLTPADVDAALDHGATYIVTPAIASSIPTAVDRGVPVLCGALTPTEVLAALDAGADAVKLFPVSSMGPRYVKDLRAPFPSTPFVPVGGVGAEDAATFLADGAVAVGVASPLLGDAANGGDLDALRERARRFLMAVRP